MSYELMRAVIEQSQASGSAKTVQIAVASYPPPGSSLAYPSNETLIREWGFTERTVQRGLRQCEALGELQRQPGMESRGRPRVYLVNPEFRRQLSMLEQPAGSELDGCQSEVDARLTPVTTPATSRGRVEGREEGLTSTPPTPQGGSASSQDFQSGDLPPVTDRSVRSAAVARRRRRRRRAVDPSPASEPCPLGAMTEREAALLAEETRALERTIRQALGDSVWEMWFPAAHLHPGQEPGAVTLGVAGLAGWVDRRYGGALERAAGGRVLVVSCDGAAARSDLRRSSS